MTILGKMELSDEQILDMFKYKIEHKQTGKADLLAVAKRMEKMLKYIYELEQIIDNCLEEVPDDLEEDPSDES